MSAVVWMIVALALITSNLPWFSERFLFFIRLKDGIKKFWMCLLEVVLMYFLIGFIAIGLERKITGEIYSQDWEFYAVTFFVFLVFSCPGFIYRYQLRHYLSSRSSKEQ